ncbi:MAG: DUF1540 domain-containing protein [Bacillota bacterium]
MAEIKCTVENCLYYKNKVCTADKIEIAQNIKTGGGYEMEAATESAIFDNTGMTKNPNETKCNTFKAKNSK